MEEKEASDEQFIEGKSLEEIESLHCALDKLWVFSGADATDTEMLLSRIDEQSTLIGILKQRSDELLYQCQALQKINSELEDKITDCHKDLDDERKKSETLGKRFVTLAANNEAIIVFKDEYKSENAELKQRNQQLQSENNALFSKKLQDSEATVQSLDQEIKQLKDKFAQQESDHSQKVSELRAKLLQQAYDYEAKQASLVEKLQSGEEKQRITEALCNDLKAELKNISENYISKESKMMESIESLKKERDHLLQESLERGKVIQEQQQELVQLEIKLTEERKLRTKTEERFKRETDTVNADAKVRSLQFVLDESTTKYEKLKKDFEAFKDHSTNLLIQERELNKKLRLMTG